MRARGLYDFLVNDLAVERFSINQLTERLSETPMYIDHTLQELENAALVKRIPQGEGYSMFELISVPNAVETAQDRFYKRIYNLFHKSAPYYWIAWFFEQEGRDYTNEVALREAVTREFPAAEIIQFSEDYKIKTAYTMLSLDENSEKPMKMSHILDYLNKKQHGEDNPERKVQFKMVGISGR